MRPSIFSPLLLTSSFFFGLPELVDPAEAVVGEEGLLRQAGQQLLQREPLLRGELDLQQHVVGAENLRQHPAGVTRRQDEAVRGRRSATGPVPRTLPG